MIKKQNDTTVSVPSFQIDNLDLLEDFSGNEQSAETHQQSVLIPAIIHFQIQIRRAPTILKLPSQDHSQTIKATIRVVQYLEIVHIEVGRGPEHESTHHMRPEALV